ncbi:UNVERIFIED_CONTAM: cytochrome [Sesamum radiatum]|uniref:Cytochrome n=1 Tax=Sesamum radiatum TaxID=300843 RepID=A0AAW2TZ32_SESRA
MVASVETLLEKWRHYEGKEIEVSGDFRILSSEVISRTAFGSSYVEGIKIFDMLQKLSVLICENTHKLKFHGLVEFVRTKDDSEADKIEQLLHESVMEILRKRQDEVITGRADSFGSDFIGSLLKAHHEGGEKNQMSAAEIIDECKTFYFAGQLTTHSLLTWSVLLLAIHPDWQEKGRTEVLQLFGRENPNLEGVARLKTPCTGILIYGDKTLISSNQTEGKPEAKRPTFTRFGPRICVGLNFASYEAKIVLSMILQRYKFTLSPNYVHSPFLALTVQPQHGVQVLLQPL